MKPLYNNLAVLVMDAGNLPFKAAINSFLLIPSLSAKNLLSGAGTMPRYSEQNAISGKITLSASNARNAENYLRRQNI